MNDINGGISYLKGLIQDVPLACGGVKTCTDLYIAEKVPFDLLLGRPWQKGSCISIDERPHGTYLIFKDPSNYEITSELLVSLTCCRRENVFSWVSPDVTLVGLFQLFVGGL